jgi:hypothetical protein
VVTIGIHFVISPLFSYTSPEVPSFLTSLRVRVPFLTLIRILGEPPQWAQCGIYHCLHEPRVFVVQSHRGGPIPGSGVICETQALPGAVIPAKAGIYSASPWKCAAEGLDSRFRGNDHCFERGPIPNDTTTPFQGDQVIEQV